MDAACRNLSERMQHRKRDRRSGETARRNQKNEMREQGYQRGRGQPIRAEVRELGRKNFFLEKSFKGKIFSA